MLLIWLGSIKMVEWFLLVRINQQKVTLFVDLLRLQIIKYNAEDLN